MKKLFLLGMMGIVWGCDPHVEMENIGAENLFSVSSFLSPQDTLYRVYLYRGLSLGSTVNVADAVVKDATVILSDGMVSDTLTLNVTNLYYETKKGKIVVAPLQTYYLNIHIQGKPLIKASSTVPPTPDVPTVTGSRANDDYEFEINWINPSSHPYFMVSANALGTYLYNSPLGLFPRSLYAQLDHVLMPSDQQQDVNTESGRVSNAYLATNPKLNVSLRNIDANMFNYLKTYHEYDQWRSNSDAYIPIFRDAKPLFTNIEGGVGIFATYNTTTMSMDIQ